MTTEATPGALGSNEWLGHNPHVKSVERYAKVLAMRRAGLTLKAIGDDLRLSRERVRQMAKKAERLEREKMLSSERPHLLLSVRTRNCLLAEYWHTHTYSTRDDPPPALVRRWLDSGELRKIPNMGKKSVQEVAAWLAAIGA